MKSVLLFAYNVYLFFFGTFDQSAWCREAGALYESDLYRWPLTSQERINEVFNDVLSRHPHHGMAYPLLVMKSIEFDGRESVSDLAKLADAVTIICIDEPALINPSGLRLPGDQTGVGNAAYVAQHHKDASVRRRFNGILETWRQDLSP